MLLKPLSLTVSLLIAPTALGSKTRGLRSLNEASGRHLDEESPPPEETPPPLEIPAPAPENESTEIISFFAVEYATSEGTLDGLEAAADALVTAYNSLSFEDEFDRVMEDVTILSSVTSEAGSGRELQLFIILSILEVSGRCTGCERGSFYSNQITRRSRQLVHALPAAGPTGGEKESQPHRKMSKGQQGKKSKKSSKKSSGKSSSSKNSREEMIIQGLPSEEDILSSYSEQIMESDVDFGNIVDVLSIVELAENPFEEFPGRKLSEPSQ